MSVLSDHLAVRLEQCATESQRLTEQRYAVAARHYIEGMLGGAHGGGIGHVMTEMGLSPGAARVLCHRARRAGYLPPTRGGVANADYAEVGASELHRPTTAEIHRGTSQSHRWLVCSSCLTPWPCDDARADAELLS